MSAPTFDPELSPLDRKILLAKLATQLVAAVISVSDYGTDLNPVSDNEDLAMNAVTLAQAILSEVDL